jgi:hypothetical protein
MVTLQGAKLGGFNGVGVGVGEVVIEGDAGSSGLLFTYKKVTQFELKILGKL